MRLPIVPVLCACLLFANNSWGAGEWEVFRDTGYARCVCADKEYIWSGSNIGAIRYNITTGESVRFTTNDGLVDNHILDIAIDQKGVVWFATTGGVSGFDGQSWRSFTKADGMAGNWAYCISIDIDGTKWFGTDHGVSSFDGEKLMSYPPRGGLAMDYVTCMTIDQQGVKWFGSKAYGVVTRFDGKTWKNFTTKDIPSGKVMSLATDTDGSIWAFAEGGGIYRYAMQAWSDVSNWKYVSGRASSIAIGKDGVKWFGMGGYGVVRFDGKTWKSYKTTDGLADNDIMDIYADSAGVVWFGTDRGVSRFDGVSWKRYSTGLELDYTNINCLSIDANGVKWVGTDGGVASFNGSEWKYYTVANGLVGNMVRCIKNGPGGTVWFGTDAGASCFDGRNWKSYTTSDGLAGNQISDIVIDVQGSIWFATNGNGISRFDGSSWKKYTTADGLASNYVNDLEVDGKGNVWGDSGGSGASCFDGQSWKVLTRNDGLLSNYVRSISAGVNGEVWFVYEQGISCFDGESWYHYFLGQPVPDITVDDRGMVWGGGKCISRFDGKSWKSNVTDPLLRDYGLNHIVRDKDGSLWILGACYPLTLISHFNFSESLPAGVSDSHPVSLSLRQNYPNPFNPSTTISFTLPRSGQARIAIFNSQGQMIRTLIDGQLTAGAHTVVWDGRDAAGKSAASGIYFSELVSRGTAERRKMLLVR